MEAMEMFRNLTELRQLVEQAGMEVDIPVTCEDWLEDSDAYRNGLFEEKSMRAEQLLADDVELFDEADVTEVKALVVWLAQADEDALPGYLAEKLGEEVGSEVFNLIVELKELDESRERRKITLYFTNHCSSGQKPESSEYELTPDGIEECKNVVLCEIALREAVKRDQGVDVTSDWPESANSEVARQGDDMAGVDLLEENRGEVIQTEVSFSEEAIMASESVTEDLFEQQMDVSPVYQSDLQSRLMTAKRQLDWLRETELVQETIDTLDVFEDSFILNGKYVAFNDMQAEVTTRDLELRLARFVAGERTAKTNWKVREKNRLRMVELAKPVEAKYPMLVLLAEPHTKKAVLHLDGRPIASYEYADGKPEELGRRLKHMAIVLEGRIKKEAERKDFLQEHIGTG